MSDRLDVVAFSGLQDRQIVAVALRGRDLIVVRYGDEVSVLSGRCPHRGARLANATIEDERVVCGSHGWDFRYRDGVSPGSPDDRLRSFTAHIDHDADVVWIGEADFLRWHDASPEVFDPDELLI